MPTPADDGIPQRTEGHHPGLLARLGRTAWLLLGLFCVGLGIIGAILPLMPTTIFLILATGCFARSSPRLEAWLLEHRRFGPTLVAWRAERAIGPRAKIMACTGIAIGFALFVWRAHPGPLLAIGTAVGMAACALYIVTRPVPNSVSPTSAD
ncbi:MAG TPA: YbaN family protein [Sphingobium sp.]